MGSSRKEILQRKLKGQSILPGWKIAFEAAAKVTINLDNFLALEKTEELRNQFFDLVKSFNNSHQFAPINALGELSLSLQPKAPQSEVVLFHSMDKYIGAYLINAETIIKNLEAIWVVTEEDLSFAIPDLANGFCLERNFYGPNGDYFPDGLLELTCWGKFGRQASH